MLDPDTFMKVERLTKLISARNADTEHPSIEELITWQKITSKLTEIVHTLNPITPDAVVSGALVSKDHVLKIDYYFPDGLLTTMKKSFIVCDASYLFRDKDDYSKDWAKTMKAFHADEKKYETELRKKARYQNYLELKKEFEKPSKQKKAPAV